jgi:hypothetical protein
LKRTLTGIAAAAMVLGTMAPAAFAATTAPAFTSGGGKTITLDGSTLYSGVQVGNALDAGTTTTYFPIWYLQQALAKGGYATSYNPSTHTWDITLPSVTASSLNIAGGVGTGNSAISVNGTVVKKFNAQFQKDLAGGKNAVVTTYFPIFYLGSVFAAAGFSNAWTGSSFGLTSYNPAFAVQSVKSLNAYQLAVTFSKPVDSTTAQASTSYVLSTASGTLALAATNGAVVQADGKTVVLTLAAPITTATDVSVTVKNVQLNAVSTTVVPLFTSVVNVSDTTPAAVSSVSSITNGATASSVTINFSEPVNSGYAKIDGVSIGSVGAAGGETSHTFGTLSLDPTQAHTLTIVNLTDGAGNVAQTTNTFTITVDKTAPMVSSVSAYSDHQILVTFSKQMDTTVVAGTPDAGNPVAGTNVLVKDENLNTITGTSVAQLTGDTTGTKFVVTLPNNIFTNPAVATSRNLTVLFAATNQDYLGNTLAQSLKTLTLTKDATAPVVTGLKYKTNATTGNVTDILVDFNKPLTTSTPAGSTVTVVDGNGVLQPSTFLATGALTVGNNEEVDFPLTTAAALTGVYSFNVASSTVTDQAAAPNGNAAYNGTINFGSGTPAATSWSLTGTPAAASATDVITVTFGQAVKGGALTGSATTPSNYSINGTVLPAGTLITLNATQTVATITVPKGTVVTTDNNASFRMAGIQNANGATLTPFIQLLSVTDNTAPVLKSAHVVDANTVVLTFSEAMAPLAAQALAAGEVTLADYQGNPIAGTLTASSVSGFPNEVKLAISGSGISASAIGHAITVTTGTSTFLTDVATNVTTAGTSVTSN